jgi:four helix bundle protein
MSTVSNETTDCLLFTTKALSSAEGEMDGMQKKANSNKPHRNLLAWRKTMDLAVETYQTTRTFPKEESYGLTSQIRRAVVSPASNIAEGAADRTRQQFSNFLSNAIGSLNELDTQLELARRLGYLTERDHDRLFQRLDECLALTYGLRRSLNKK